MIEQEKLLTNPFPGLRPFRMEESDMFFGRDGQSDQILTKLGTAHFVAVVGTSGSGKSSLVAAGLLPALFSGHLASAGSRWRIASFRPGRNPIRNLAESLNAPDVCGTTDQQKAAEHLENIERTLRRSSLGLLEVVSQSKFAPGENLLILADQFEELFRFRKESPAPDALDEAAAFVKLLLEAKQGQKTDDERLPIYVVLTMRTEYLGTCANFWGLPEAINEGQYLIPRMTDDNRREAIIGPVIIGGGEIAAPLVNRLLNDAGDEPSRLPILQHALMRTWDYWKNATGGTGAIDISHYEAIGSMKHALSRHADEAFFDLTPDLQSVAAGVFKAVTEKDVNSNEGRRPATVSAIAKSWEVSEPEVVAVIESFRREGRSFLMPGPPVALTSDTMIDISHESLISGWVRLCAWVEEETDAARQYVRLANKAALFPAEEDYLRDPALTNGLKWLEDNHPTKAWAERYHPAFDKTIEYLELSKANRQAELDRKEQQQKEEIERDLRHAQALAAGERRRVKLRNVMVVVLSLLVLILTAIAVVAFQQTQVAREKTREVNVQKAFLEKQSVSLQQALKDVQLERDNATHSEAEAKRQEAIAKGALITAREKTEKALQAEAEAARQRDSAEQQRAKAVKQEAIAKAAKVEADQQKELVVASLAEENQARLEAVRSEAAALAAKEDAIKAKRDAEMALGIVHEIDKAAPYFSAVIRGHNSPVTKAWSAGNDNVLFTQAADGSAQMWDARVALPDLADQPYLADNITKPVLYSRDGKLVVLANYQGRSIVWDISSRKELFELPWNEVDARDTLISPNGQLILHQDKTTRRLGIFDIHTGRSVVGNESYAAQDFSKIVLSADSSLLGIVSGSGAGVVNTASAKGISLTGHLDEVISISFSRDNKFAVTASKDGTAKVWDMRNGNTLVSLSGHEGPVNSAVFSNDARYIVTTSGKQAYLWEAKSPASWTEVTAGSPARLTGHTDVLTNASFSPDGKWVATVSQDRTAQLWEAKVPNLENGDVAKSVAVFRGHIKPLTSVDFSPNSKFLVTASEDRTARVWDLRSFGEFEVVNTSLDASPAIYAGKCPANVKVIGTISVAGRSGSVTYKFVRSDGTESLPQSLTFDGPGSREVSESRDVFSSGLHRGGVVAPTRGWVKIRILDPAPLDSNEAAYTVTCPGDDAMQLLHLELSARELRQIMPALTDAQLALYLSHLQKAMEEFGINTPLRRAAFLAQVAHESAELTQLVELGSDADIEHRNGLRKELGNFEPGDGARYKGRGVFQMAGKSRYQAFGALLGIDLLADPDKAAAPEVAFRIAALFWQKNGLNELADERNFLLITKRINGGYNGLDDRIKYYDRAKHVLGIP
jgi:WD40 repeat protein/predicted chitinase